MSPPLLPRALKVLQALAVVAERRGHRISAVGNPTNEYGQGRWTGPNHGHVQVAVGRYTHAFRILEPGLPSRAHWERTHWHDRERYPDDGSGAVAIHMCGDGGNGRTSRWTDGKRSLEERLAEILHRDRGPRCRGREPPPGARAPRGRTPAALGSCDRTSQDRPRRSQPRQAPRQATQRLDPVSTAARIPRRHAPDHRADRRRGRPPRRGGVARLGRAPRRATRPPRSPLGHARATGTTARSAATVPGRLESLWAVRALTPGPGRQPLTVGRRDPVSPPAPTDRRPAQSNGTTLGLSFRPSGLAPTLRRRR